VLYYLAENLAARAAEFTARLRSFGATEKAAAAEVEASVRRCFWYAAQADKFDGAVRQTGSKNVALAMREPLGVVGVACPTAHPLLGFVSTVLPAIAMGNAAVAIPSQPHPLAATDFYQLLDTSDVPAGVVNIVAGPAPSWRRRWPRMTAWPPMWWFGDAAGGRMVEAESAGNLKQTWTEPGMARDWTTPEGHGRAFLHRATQIKNIWVPYGE
jgi:aldehyde dehydrogenase (NAD+)